MNFKLFFLQVFILFIGHFSFADDSTELNARTDISPSQINISEWKELFTQVKMGQSTFFISKYTPSIKGVRIHAQGSDYLIFLNYDRSQNNSKLIGLTLYDGFLNGEFYKNEVFDSFDLKGKHDKIAANYRKLFELQEEIKGRLKHGEQLHDTSQIKDQESRKLIRINKELSEQIDSLITSLTGKVLFEKVRGRELKSYSASQLGKASGKAMTKFITDGSVPILGVTIFTLVTYSFITDFNNLAIVDQLIQIKDIIELAPSMLLLYLGIKRFKDIFSNNTNLQEIRALKKEIINRFPGIKFTTPKNRCEKSL